MLLSLLGFELRNYIFILQFLYCRARLFVCVYVARCCVSDHCYLSFDPFFSIVAFLESCVMRKIEDFVFSSPRFALRFVLRELAIFLLCFEYAIKLALSKYLKSFGFKGCFAGAEGSVNKQHFLELDRGLPFVNETTTLKIYFARTCGPLRKQLLGLHFSWRKYKLVQLLF